MRIILQRFAIGGKTEVRNEKLSKKVLKFCGFRKDCITFVRVYKQNMEIQFILSNCLIIINKHPIW
ncbi:hypothetical protein DWW10_21575 [Bacteroides intestinalis]|uniref:Uncharacterized protein n=1 Tax=Bacteroides intestinalis TaxID=329854 RepID=A0A412XUE3_9BACE|nr:hypothetical protein DWW10_21575 [Bacteroides intestinalis]RHA55106.1 hypothetical protein DW932_21490 [Bacteroides intestinalis]